MLFTLSLIILTSFVFAGIMHKLHLPRIVGMLLAGIVLGPQALDLIAPEVLAISADLREIALIIILLRVGLSLDMKDLKKIGTPAFLISFLPAIFEMMAVTALSMWLFHFTLLEGAILGSILAAVSPAIVVPRMLVMIKEKHGTRKGIPQLIMAGASIDDILVIVIFTSLIQIEQQGQFSYLNFINLPISLITGTLLGIIVALLVHYVFQKIYLRHTAKGLVLLSLAIFFVTLEKMLIGMVPVSGLIAILAMGITFLSKNPDSANRLVSKYEKIWVFAETLLFVLVGSVVDISVIPHVGFITIGFLALSLLIRSGGVYLSLIPTNYTKKEKLFCVYAYIPKATVKASIGSPIEE